jgi:hypothetical protein
MGAVLVMHPQGVKGAISYGIIDPLLAGRLIVLTLDAWGAGALAALQRDPTVDHFLCFNRSDAALRVQDVLNGVGVLSAGAGLYAQNAPGTGAESELKNAPETGAESNLKNAPETGAESKTEGRLLPVHLLGLGQAGLWCLLARALCGAACGAARTIVDAAQFACDDDRAWLNDLYLPQVRRAGDLRTAVALTAPGALHVHNAAPGFPSPFARRAYAAAGAPDALHIQSQRADVQTLLHWLDVDTQHGTRNTGQATCNMQLTGGIP